MNLVRHYFPHLTSEQITHLEALAPLFLSWNQRINLISRKDEEHLETRHILHSLSIARFITFNPGVTVADLGTGGGFPGLPLAILFPETRFVLVDSIGKKIRAVQAMIDELGLSNVRAVQSRFEDLDIKADFVTSRAVAPFQDLIKWTRNSFQKENKHVIKNGLICLKGRSDEEEARLLKRPYTLVSLTEYFQEDFFSEKALIHIPII